MLLAMNCGCIVEFGVRTGRSTRAFAAGLKGALFSYDIADPKGEMPKNTDQFEWLFTKANTAFLKSIPDCDLLFIDTLHAESQVMAELRHAPSVRKWIVLHDTYLFGEYGEDQSGERGIGYAISAFLRENSECWRKVYVTNACNGLTILERIA
ncbi:class I SAM-dependent methyltransferase [Thiocapsa sp. N5-Cardenillas]|uniref:class I SAM-dependent methyltransferase n=1 Tax=Thiocapsa sp. N5-Cardenillas TaxID=3137397 RepID=UPI0035B3EB63